MKTFKNEKKINILGEFDNKNLEREFSQQDMLKSVRYIKPLSVFLVIVNTLFLIPDYFLIHDSSTFRNVAIARVIFVILALALLKMINYILNFSTLSYWITALEITNVLMFLYVYSQYPSPNFLIQAFGVMVIQLAVFMVPNRWINMIFASVVISIGFAAISVNCTKDLKTSEFSAGFVYLGIVIFLCGIMAYRNHYIKRIQFLSSKELLKISNTDYLTGVYNRAKLDDELKRWIRFSKRYNTRLSLVIVDIDDFKTINDTYGHLLGDNVLVKTAQLVLSSIRRTDVFARWGGEEFILLLPNNDVEKSAYLAEQLREKIEKFNFEGVINVTCSFGIAQYTPDDSSESLINKADKMLYKAKSMGKNKVEY